MNTKRFFSFPIGSQKIVLYCAMQSSLLACAIIQNLLLLIIWLHTTQFGFANI